MFSSSSRGGNSVQLTDFFFGILEKDGCAPLSKAAEKGSSTAVVTLLLQYGADPDTKFKGECKPIDMARTKNHSELVTLLTNPPPPVKSAKALVPSVQSVTSALSSASLSPKPVGLEAVVNDIHNSDCSYCGKLPAQEAFYTCSCGKTRYCDRKCQLAHWKEEHKKECPFRKHG